jgi:DNA topoisomerase-1
VLGQHPKDKQAVELHSGRYGPYVKHGNVNATLPDTDQVDSLTLAQALDLLAAKSKKSGSRDSRASPKAAAKPVRRKRAA